MAFRKQPAGNFTILYFASASSHTKRESEHIPAPLKASDLFDALEKRYPGMKQKVLNSCALTVNLAYVDLEDEKDKETVINEGDEVGIIPPVSSG